MALECLTLGWTFTFLFCFKLFHSAWGDCGTPPVIPNTNLVVETSGKSGDTFVYSCDRTTGYYEIPGKRTFITCQDNGRWTVIEKFCIRGCHFPERLVYAEPTESSSSQNSFLPGTVYSYRCRPGYLRVPGTRASITCLSDYTWSTPETFCQRRSCGKPGEVENGNMQATDFLFGSTVIYTCNVGYRLSSRRNTRQCQADGTWSKSLPQCDAVICPAPDKPDNAQYYPKKDEYTYLDSVTFSCQQPFQIVGEASISCTATGEWSSSSPICKGGCHFPERLVYAELTESSLSQNSFLPGTVYSYRCRPGYVRVPGTRASITCLSDYTWSTPETFCQHIVYRADKIPDSVKQMERGPILFLNVTL
ncbi:complement decay-accelerating factor-like isoform X2 [Pyxicephalus adspersus]|uniref:complement decay-accelerating factor-like isoform X2 n=1 Tax=Pyxicephalus adspersus TaxID=30357 RepID=UPI003B5CE972